MRLRIQNQIYTSEMIIFLPRMEKVKMELIGTIKPPTLQNAQPRIFKRNLR